MYAKKTSVSVERTKVEIEKLIQKFGAQQFFSGWDKSGAAIIGFRMQDRFVRFRLPVVPTKSPVRGYSHPQPIPQDRLAQLTRSRWRALFLVLKAKLEAVESGISTFETEFLGNVTLPDGRTCGEWAAEQLPAIYQGGVMPPMLPSGRDGY